MKKYEIFDIMGPIMIGPSSSHTAGAARIGKMAKIIYGKSFNRVSFHLHGSFKETYQGHGSDRALVGGVLGFEPDDERLVYSLNLAADMGIEYDFIPADLGYVHPNTVKVCFEDNAGDSLFYIIASSIGGGKIEIIDVNGIPVKFSGEYPTIIIEYVDRFGMIRDISTVLTDGGINIAQLRVTRDEGIAKMVMELDQRFDDSIIEKINGIPNMINLISINTDERSADV